MLRTAQSRLAPSERRAAFGRGRAGTQEDTAQPALTQGWEAADPRPLARPVDSGEQALRSMAGPGSPGFGDGDNQSGTAIVTKTKPRTKRPNLYRVLLLNDDYTPMEFVVHVLERFFNKNREDATRIMLHVHQNGVGECGVFTYEVAETKVTQVMDFARKHQHPLQCVMEKK
jgi:ATP-dependent Clp protease adaptor protein ClpS